MVLDVILLFMLSGLVVVCYFIVHFVLLRPPLPLLPPFSPSLPPPFFHSTWLLLVHRSSFLTPNMDGRRISISIGLNNRVNK